MEGVGSSTGSGDLGTGFTGAGLLRNAALAATCCWTDNEELGLSSGGDGAASGDWAAGSVEVPGVATGLGASALVALFSLVATAVAAPVGAFLLGPRALFFVMCVSWGPGALGSEESPPLAGAAAVESSDL